AKKAADKKKADDAKKAADQKRIEQAKLDDSQAKPADDISNIINSEDTRGATTDNGGTPNLGKANGRSATLSNSEMGALIAAMRDCINVPLGAAEEGAK